MADFRSSTRQQLFNLLDLLAQGELTTSQIFSKLGLPRISPGLPQPIHRKWYRRLEWLESHGIIKSWGFPRSGKRWKLDPDPSKLDPAGAGLIFSWRCSKISLDIWESEYVSRLIELNADLYVDWMKLMLTILKSHDPLGDWIIQRYLDWFMGYLERKPKRYANREYVEELLKQMIKLRLRELALAQPSSDHQ